MKVGIIDADLLGRKRHRFPNLVCMKLSGYHKILGDDVRLLCGYGGLESYDRIYLSKVFTDTPVPESVLRLPNVEYGGTGFYYDRAPALPDAVEHHRPDYHLYDAWVNARLQEGCPPRELAFYTDYSIGFLTRGCFRKCPFCVNRNYSRVSDHSPLSEFYDPERPKICLLDDNFLGHPGWREMLCQLQSTGKPFLFKQGLDERLLTPEKCEVLFRSRYDGDYMFAFDSIEDRNIIEPRIDLARRYTNANLKFYCFTGYDRGDRWDDAFWVRDLRELFDRIEILMRHRCLPYIMRFERYKESPYRGVYVTLARWCNQPGFYRKMSLREFIAKPGNESSKWYLDELERDHPEFSRYIDLKYSK